MSGATGDPGTPVPVTLALHECMALALLYDNAPSDINLTANGVWYGRSVDTAMLHIADALARATDNKDMLLRNGMLWALLDQEKASS